MGAPSLSVTNSTLPQPLGLVAGGLGVAMPRKPMVVLRRGDAHLVPVDSGRFLLVEVLPDGTRRPAVRAGFNETDEQASTFPSAESAAFFAVNVLRARGVDSILDIEPLPRSAS